ncbi:MAG: hypothetical protein FJX29_12915 [Alphaproteobacteria bacterium]|nr:hypothetical protein [Alphaproteobacteria bacterium]
MDRRVFMRSLFAAGGAVALGVSLTPSRSEASPLLETLKDLDRAPAPAAVSQEAAPEADLPARGAAEAQWRRRRRRRLVRRCVYRRNRWGRVTRVCRFG